MDAIDRAFEEESMFIAGCPDVSVLLDRMADYREEGRLATRRGIIKGRLRADDLVELAETRITALKANAIRAKIQREQGEWAAREEKERQRAAKEEKERVVLAEKSRREEEDQRRQQAQAALEERQAAEEEERQASERVAAERRAQDAAHRRREEGEVQAAAERRATQAAAERRATQAAAERRATQAAAEAQATAERRAVDRAAAEKRAASAQGAREIEARSPPAPAAGAPGPSTRPTTMVRPTPPELPIMAPRADRATPADRPDIGLTPPTPTTRPVEEPANPVQVVEPTSPVDGTVYTGADLLRFRSERSLTQRQAALLLGVAPGTIAKAELLPAKPLGEALQVGMLKVLTDRGGAVLP
jgi:hypothetical protein